ncbi:MAG: hypothetical protein KDD37_04005 [Bdellovibrionales bacterium]|nr:hypothetical protein [Bdellovibrionales bacterium]
MFKEKFYRTKDSKYPTAKVSFEESDKLFIAVWSWGAADGGQKALDIIKDYYLSARTDIEATSPFPLNPEQSLAANHLRIGVMLANNIIAKENNSEEYTTGIEVLCMSKSQREINIAHVGGPSIISLRDNQKPTVYLQQNHLGHEFNFKVTNPLPKDLLGIKQKQNVNVQSIRSIENEKFLLVQRNYIPILDLKDNSLEKIEDSLVSDNKDLPFWICEFRL